jgi:hypothetical protein
LTGRNPGIRQEEDKFAMRKQFAGLLLILMVMALLPGLAVAQDDEFCEGAPAPRLTPGTTARVTDGPSNNVRSRPNLASSRVGQLPGGAVFTVLDGPQCADGYVWWEIEYQDITGWTVEGIEGEYYLLPALGGEETEDSLVEVAPVAPGWQVYSNSTFGFALSYPPDWVVTEIDHGVLVTGGTYQLTIGARNATEEFNLLTQEIGAGSLAPIDGVQFINQILRVDGRRDRGVVKAFFYVTADGAMEIPVGDLIFALRFDDTREIYDQISLTEEMRETVNQIVESVALGDVPAAAPLVESTEEPPVVDDVNATPEADAMAEGDSGLMPEVIEETNEG